MPRGRFYFSFGLRVGIERNHIESEVRIAAGLRAGISDLNRYTRLLEKVFHPKLVKPSAIAEILQIERNLNDVLGGEH